MAEQAKATQTKANAKATRRHVTGTVMSDKTPKTIVVAVERRVRHRLYGKAYNVTKKFMAHVDGELPKVGETVTIEETRPLSARKRWRLVETVKTGPATKSGGAK